MNALQNSPRFCIILDHWTDGSTGCTYFMELIEIEGCDEQFNTYKILSNPAIQNRLGSTICSVIEWSIRELMLTSELTKAKVEANQSEAINSDSTKRLVTDSKATVLLAESSLEANIDASGFVATPKATPELNEAADGDKPLGVHQTDDADMLALSSGSEGNCNSGIIEEDDSSDK
ncbi:uncharacterized protein PHACADRAFT_30204 [Phanerochaete carnosa HHB-10118-sp]|uniref:Uncharacterized protein n=1 Tax=Phanerochaete carnosa (strain HHB-10118-sp) TaxID=650164 RepID=K5UT81_PHACS|nr:uncharacterized protein PHACADRAFT_30204 [Phanerochaete carnosa HHB-10118-sp]EKM53161.1 hypothetical protein PHACADRAFT_30204 [Phanerochaete carnosa HHB-10118-sp]